MVVIGDDQLGVKTQATIQALSTTSNARFDGQTGLNYYEDDDDDDIIVGVDQIIFPGLPFAWHLFKLELRLVLQMWKNYEGWRGGKN